MGKPNESLNVTVVDFSDPYEGLRERRKTDRLMIGSLISVHCSLGDRQMFDAELVDVSHGGCKLRLPLDGQKVSVSSSTVVPVRFCFGENTYLNLDLYVVAYEEFAENGVRYARLGCSLDQTASGYRAYERLIQFLSTYAELADRDVREAKVGYL